MLKHVINSPKRAKTRQKESIERKFAAMKSAFTIGSRNKKPGTGFMTQTAISGYAQTTSLHIEKPQI